MPPPQQQRHTDADDDDGKKRATRTLKEEEDMKKNKKNMMKKTDDLSLMQPMVSIQRRFYDTPLFLARQVLLFHVLATACVYGCVSAAALVVTGRRDRANSNIAAMVKTLSFVTGIETRLVGGEHLFGGERPCVFVCNHQSFLDLLMLGTTFPKDCVIMAKNDILFVPFIGQYLWAAGNVFIDRKNTRSALDTMRKVADELKRKKMGLFIFPEGTRSHQTTNDLLPFKKGAFQLAIQGGMPIVPIVVGSYHDLYNSKEMYFRGGIMNIKVLSPVPTKGLDVKNDIDGLMNTIRGDMLRTLREISKPAPVHRAKL